jgi:hypothetical protein
MTKKIYLVKDGYNNEYSFAGVFSTKENAKQFIITRSKLRGIDNEENWWGHGLWIEDYELDKDQSYDSDEIE